jgi:hypothetical protein
MQAKNNRLLLIACFTAIFLTGDAACLDRNDSIRMMINRVFGFRFFQATCNQLIFLRSLYTKRKVINLFLSYVKVVSIFFEFHKRCS